VLRRADRAVLAARARAARVSLLATRSGVLALFAVADTLKPTRPPPCASCRRMGVTPVMLTGDNQATAEAVGRRRADGRTASCCRRTS
jgi:Cd2+/Zn2+-exporting ATPase